MKSWVLDAYTSVNWCLSYWSSWSWVSKAPVHSQEVPFHTHREKIMRPPQLILISIRHRSRHWFLIQSVPPLVENCTQSSLPLLGARDADRAGFAFAALFFLATIVSPI